MLASRANIKACVSPESCGERAFRPALRRDVRTAKPDIKGRRGGGACAWACLAPFVNVAMQCVKQCGPANGALSLGAKPRNWQPLPISKCRYASVTGKSQTIM